MSYIECPACGEFRSVEQIATPDGWANPKCAHCGDGGWTQPYGEDDPLAGRGASEETRTRQPVVSDDELPGMWENADLIHGETDCADVHITPPGPSFIVLRHGPDVPRQFWAEDLEGRWIEHDPNHITRPGPEQAAAQAIAEPTGRYETRDDGVTAEVWQIRLTAIR